MLTVFRPALVVFGILTIVTGVVYPVAVTLISQVAFNHQANGSVIRQDGKSVGSELIGQQFIGLQYFWSRPSATGPAYNGGASTGSNLGPTNPALMEAVQQRVDALRVAHPNAKGDVPVELVTASGSGLDPHISPAAAEFQAERVAAARGVPKEQILKVLAAHTEGRTFGVLGEPRINVVRLNLALDELAEENR
jgi:potassium-transporting ATPase KdpC subunit